MKDNSKRVKRTFYDLIIRPIIPTIYNNLLLNCSESEIETKSISSNGNFISAIILCTPAQFQIQ